MRSLLSFLLGSGIVGVIAFTNAPASNTSTIRDATKKAAATLRPLREDGKVNGSITFTDRGDHVEIVGVIMGLTPGEHGFHIHEFGDCCSPEGECAGGHFDPKGSAHGGPDDPQRHVGDLGNIKADGSGCAMVSIKDKMIRLSGEHSIIGRAVVVHADGDDLKTQPSGNAGDRVACGVIGIVSSNSNQHDNHKK
jgi:Cu-Zn family superoxide dismutase